MDVLFQRNIIRTNIRTMNNFIRLVTKNFKRHVMSNVLRYSNPTTPFFSRIRWETRVIKFTINRFLRLPTYTLLFYRNTQNSLDSATQSNLILYVAFGRNSQKKNSYWDVTAAGVSTRENNGSSQRNCWSSPQDSFVELSLLNLTKQF